MSEKHPECPLYNPLNCKEYYNPKLCAFVRKDKDCLKKKKPKPKPKAPAEDLSFPQLLDQLEIEGGSHPAQNG